MKRAIRKNNSEHNSLLLLLWLKVTFVKELLEGPYKLVTLIFPSTLWVLHLSLFLIYIYISMDGETFDIFSLKNFLMHNTCYSLYVYISYFPASTMHFPFKLPHLYRKAYSESL